MSDFKKVKEYVRIVTGFEKTLEEIDTQKEMKEIPILLVKKVLGKTTFIMIDSGYNTNSVERIRAVAIKEGSRFSFYTTTYSYSLDESSYTKCKNIIKSDKLHIINMIADKNYEDREFIEKAFEASTYKDYLKEYNNNPVLLQVNKFAATDLSNAVIEDIRENGIFKDGTLAYNKERGNIVFARCSVCGNEVSSELQYYSISRNDKVSCPNCKNRLTAYPTGQPLHYKPVNKTVVFQKVKGTIYIRSFKIASNNGELSDEQAGILSVSKDGKVTQYILDERYTVDKVKAPLFYPEEFKWNSRNESLLKDVNNVYGLNKGILSNTAFQYMSLTELEHHAFKGSIIEYIEVFNKYPIVEIYEKAGGSYTIRDMVEMYHRNSYGFYGGKPREFWINSDGTVEKLYFQSKFIELISIYKLSVYACEDLRGKYEATRFSDKNGTLVYPVMDNAAFREFFLATRNVDVSVISELSEYAKSEMVKVCQYIKTQEEVDLVEYRDYLRMRNHIHTFKATNNTLKLSKWSKYPKDLKNSHDEIIKEYDICTAFLEEEKYEEIYNDIKKYDYSPENSDYIITVPETIAQIAEEGNALSHCVKTYIPEVLKRRTVIVFVRKKDEPETPLYTVEYINGYIIQTKGYDNCKCPDDVNSFINEWVAYCSSLDNQRKAS